jgi:hypothetical protein
VINDDAWRPMWREQEEFHSRLTFEVSQQLGSTGFTGRPKVMLVGFPLPGPGGEEVCIEPDDSQNTSPDVQSALASIAGLDRYARARALEGKLAGRFPRRSFFVGRGTRIYKGGYEIHAVVSVDTAALGKVPRFGSAPPGEGVAVPSIVHAVIAELLKCAQDELHIENAGAADTGRLGSSLRQPCWPEVGQRATALMLRSALTRAGDAFNYTAEEDLRGFSSLLYEGRLSAGHLMLAAPAHPAVSWQLRWKNEIPLSDSRHIRKLLEASGDRGALVIDGRSAHGLALVKENYDDTTEAIFEIIVSEPGHWRLHHGATVLVDVRADQPTFPQPVPHYFAELRDTVKRTLPGTDLSALEKLAAAAGRHLHGAMLIISADAAAEADRLHPQATRSDPAIPISPEMLEQVTNTDGGVLVDPQGHPHAIGVILDGTANHNGDPARGSRYNNAVRYLAGKPPPAVVLCYSTDGDVTIMSTSDRNPRAQYQAGSSQASCTRR